MDIPKPDNPPQRVVGITYNLKGTGDSGAPDMDAEYDEIGTILALKNALETSDCRVELFEATEALADSLRKSRPDIVFNFAEGRGGRGREAQVPALLNFLGIPFTGSDETTLCISLDKALTKRLLQTYGIRTPNYKIVRRDKKIPPGRLRYPVIVKPNAEGSSKGISDVSIAPDGRRLRQVLNRNIDIYGQDMLVEEYIPGREFTVGILGNGAAARVFPPMEIIYKNEDAPYNIYSYDVKRNFRQFIRYECPPDIDAGIREEIERQARKIYEVLECRDCARIDFRLSPDGLVYFIEINPLPGLAPGYSDFPMAAEFCGLDYNALVTGILVSALKRHNMSLL